MRNSGLLKLAGRRHFQQAFGLLREWRRFDLDFVRAFDRRVLYSDPLAYFQTSFFGQIEKLDACIFLRFSHPGDLSVRFDEVSGIRQPETNLGDVVSGQTGDGLHVHAAFAEIQEDAAVGGTEVDVLEREYAPAHVGAAFWDVQVSRCLRRLVGHSLRRLRRQLSSSALRFEQ